MRSDRIKQLEEKFLDFSKRTRDDHPAKALTPAEREEYAQYLETKGHVKGAASFRNYVEPQKTEKQKPSRRSVREF